MRLSCVSRQAHERKEHYGRFGKFESTVWDYKYHVMFILKCRRKASFGELRKCLGEGFHRPVRKRETQILEGYLMVDHVHILLQLSPKYAVAQVRGDIKRKSAIRLARVSEESKRNFVD